MPIAALKKLADEAHEAGQTTEDEWDRGYARGLDRAQAIVRDSGVLDLLTSAVRDLEKGRAPGREWLAAVKKLLGEGE